MTLKLNSAGIIGIGYHVPEKILTNADIEKLVCCKVAERRCR